MKILQLNLNHCEAAQDLLGQSIVELKIDVAIIAEPYKVPENNLWLTDRTGKAAVWACGKFPFQRSIVSNEEGFLVTKINGVILISCYAPPSWNLEKFEQMLDRIVAVADSSVPTVLAGDFNAWAVEWGSSSSNARGMALLEALSPLDLVLVNTGSTSTFRRNGLQSIIDLTFTSMHVARGMNWQVSEHYTHSDHQALLYEVLPSQMRGREIVRVPSTTKRWASKAFDKEVFCEMIRDVNIHCNNVNDYATSVVRCLVAACDASMPRRKSTTTRRAVFWWNDKVKDLRAKCLNARRKSQRATGQVDFAEKHRSFTLLRKTLRNEIRKSKKDCFKQLCADADNNPWGSAYRVVMKKIKGTKSPQELCPKLLHEIVLELFPNHRTRPLRGTQQQDTSEIPPVTVDEILEISKTVGVNKASGPDQIPNVAIKVALESNPVMIANCMQVCLVEGIFPKIWKRQRLVLIPKVGKAPGVPSSYRPICLLDTLGKILERVILKRLLPIAEGSNGLSNLQFGFRRSRSTLDAVRTVVSLCEEAIRGKRWRGGTKEYGLVVTLDVKNAFNTANWGQVMKALRDMKVPGYLLNILENYFGSRILEYDTLDGPKEYVVSAGVPQGSVLGPILWNIMYDGILQLGVPVGATIVGFADDIAVVVTAKHVDEVELIANETILKVMNWLESVGLKLAEQKTEALLISSRKTIETAKVNVGSHVIESKHSLKYLGVLIDNRLSFKPHVKYACEKARKVHSALSAMMPNIGGPKSSRRRLLASVVKSTLLYASPIWVKALAIKSNRRQLETVQRVSALRVASAFRTTSADAALVVAGMMPIAIVVEEASELYEYKSVNAVVTSDVRKRAREIALLKWQEGWSESDKGRWSYRLIPLIDPWLKRNHGEINYHITQFLTGHGCYRSYLHRFKNDSSPYCPRCKSTEETAEHVVFHCPRFDVIRSKMEEDTSTVLSPENVVNVMLKSEAKWNAICEGVTLIHIELRRAEAMRNSAT